MTEYEKLSLALLSSIAQGIAHQIEAIDIATLSELNGASRQDIFALRTEQRKSLDSWIAELARLDAIVRQNDPERYDPKGDGNND